MVVWVSPDVGVTRRDRERFGLGFCMTLGAWWSAQFWIRNFGSFSSPCASLLAVPLRMWRLLFAFNKPLIFLLQAGENVGGLCTALLVLLQAVDALLEFGPSSQLHEAFVTAAGAGQIKVCLGKAFIVSLCVVSPLFRL